MDNYDYVYEVYKEKSFTSAAKNLYISQPALSSAVKKVESELGITIFDRSTMPIRLTEEGKVFIESVEKIKNIRNETKEKLADMEQLKFGKIIVSGENFVSSFIMPEIIMTYSKKYPNIDIELVESNSPELRQQLINDTIDLLIAHDFDKDLYASEPLIEETLLLAVPENYQINSVYVKYALTHDDVLKGKHLSFDCPKIDLKKFKDMPYILLKKGNDTRSRAEELFAEAGFTPENVVIYLDQLITSYNMVCFGLGVAFINDELIKNSKQTGCVFYKINGKQTKRTMSIGYKRNKYVSKAMQAFIDTAKEVYYDKKR